MKEDPTKLSDELASRFATSARYALILALSLIAISAVSRPSLSLAQQPLDQQTSAPDSADTHEQSEQVEQADELDGPGRRPRDSMSRVELKEAGFVFEDMLDLQARAQATLFAMTAGAVIHGAGHWQLGDRRTALALLGMEAAGITMIAGGLILAINPSGLPALDERRRELWHLGIGVVAMSWLIDVFGTAYHDDLGIPRATAREIGWGAGINYEYWRPKNLSLRHAAAAHVAAKTRRLHLHLQSTQELGYGMSDYALTGRWFPLVGSSPQTRLGLEISPRYLQYRLDEPFERGQLTLSLIGALDLGRFFPHLDQMSAGFELGLGARMYRFPTPDDDVWTPWRYGGWFLPLRLFLALNLTEALRLQVAFERQQGKWLEQKPSRIGVPVLELSYRSTQRLDLTFFFALGDGAALGAGLTFWLGE